MHIVRLAMFVALLVIALMPSGLKAGDSVGLAGKWTYRSFHNNSNMTDGNPEKVAALLFAEATFTFEAPTSTTIKGTIDWPGGGLDLEGKIQANDPSAPTFEIIGKGRAGTGTEGWEYDYYGELAHSWPNAVNQVPAMVGSVIRAKPHGNAPAGYVASFIAVKQ